MTPWLRLKRWLGVLSPSAPFRPGYAEAYGAKLDADMTDLETDLRARGWAARKVGDLSSAQAYDYAALEARRRAKP